LIQINYNKLLEVVYLLGHENGSN